MNYHGSYRKLLANAKAATIAAIEVYNKPTFRYRDECFVILLMNAWELLLKAILAKNKKSIYYPKRRGEPYKTLSCRDALQRVEGLLPVELPALPIKRNLELLGTFRDNAIHFYNSKGFTILVYALAQTSIINMKDVMKSVFGLDIAKEVSWRLLPIGIEQPVDPIAYMAGARQTERNPAVREFFSELQRAISEVEAAGADAARLLAVFSVKLESVKKVGSADIVMGINGSGGSGAPAVVTRWQNPNVTHPLRQKEVLEQIGTLCNEKFTSHVFQAIAWKYGLKANLTYCWQAQEGVLTKYSNDILPWLRRLKAEEIMAAVSAYRTELRSRAGGNVGTGSGR